MYKESDIVQQSSVSGIKPYLLPREDGILSDVSTAKLYEFLFQAGRISSSAGLLGAVGSVFLGNERTLIGTTAVACIGLLSMTVSAIGPVIEAISAEK